MEPWETINQENTSVKDNPDNDISLFLIYGHRYRYNYMSLTRPDTFFCDRKAIGRCEQQTFASWSKNREVTPNETEQVLRGF